MIIAAVTFLVVLALVSGLYWLLVLRPERQMQTVLRARLRDASHGEAPRESVLQAPRALSSVALINVLLVRSAGLSGPLERLVTQSGLRISVAIFLLATALAGAAAALIVSVLSYRTWLVLPAAAVAAALPYVVVRYARTRRLRAFEQQFPDAIDMMARALRAGHALPTAISMAAEELPAPVGPECRLLYDRQNFGMPMAEALKGFAERIPIIDARFFVTAVLTQREAGGNLAEVLDNLAAVIRDRFTVKRQVRVATAHSRITGLVLCAMPLVLAAALWVLSPSYMKLLVTDPLGVKMIGAGLLLQVSGTLIIRKLVNVPY